MPSEAAGLEYVIEQIWGPAISRGHARAVVSGPVPEGWEARERYWIIPSAGSAQLLVPRDRRVAARALADYARLRPLKTRMVRQGLAAAVRAGAPLSRDSLTIAAPPAAPPTTVAEIGMRVGAPLVFATFGVRTAANAKPTLELREPAGDAVGFVKLGWNAITRSAVENEAVAMRTMGVASRPAIIAPGVLADGALDEGTVDARPFVMIAPLPRGIRHVPAESSSLSRDEALGPGTVERRGAIGGTGQFRSCLAALHDEATVAPAALVRSAQRLAARIAKSTVEVPVANFWHGDFVWWNTGRDPRGRLWLFDWETAQQDAPAGLDTLHWYAHTRDAENPHSVVARAEASALHARPLLRSLGHSEAGVSLLAAWYAVVLVAGEIRLAESLGGWGRIKHPPAVLEELLAWGARRFDGASGANGA